MIELELFGDVQGLAPAADTNPETPRNSICRICATEVLLWGLREWWVRERKKGVVEDSRADCPDGNACGRQKDNGISPSILT